MTEKCETCRFWCDITTHGAGACHRHAPPAVNIIPFAYILGELAAMRRDLPKDITAEDVYQTTDYSSIDTPHPEDTHWATTASDDWCGEWQRK